MELTMMCGIPASGKTHEAQKYINSHIILSSDAIREELGIKEQTQKAHTKVFSTLHKRVIDNFKLGNNVVYDATNLSSRRRRNYISELRKQFPELKTKIILMLTDIDICRVNNHNRSRTVDEDVIFNKVMQFQVPTYHEGWNTIEIITITDKEWNFLADINNCVYDISQENPHHKHNLDTHMKYCGDYATSIMSCFNVHDVTYNALVRAAYMHDIGKIWTKEKDNRGIAHYYNHDCVGAYMSLFYNQELPLELRLEIAAIINHHHAFFGATQDEKLDIAHRQIQLEKSFGEDLVKKLRLINICDRAATH